MPRLTITLAVLLAIQAIVWWTNRGFSAGEVTVPSRKLAMLPTRLGQWTGEDAELDERLVGAIGARDVLSRYYSDAQGSQIGVHVAVIGDGVDGVGHYPEVCYKGSGWEIAKREPFAVGSSKRNEIQARLLLVERDGVRARVLFWYRMGDQIFVDRDSFKTARRAFFGRYQWPAPVKVLIHIPEDAAEESMKQVSELAGSVDTWIKECESVAN